MTTIVYGYMNRCDCGNLFLPNAKDTCPECIRKVKSEKFAQLAQAREIRRQERIFKKEQRKQRRKTDA